MKKQKISFRVDCDIEDYNQSIPKREIKTIYIDAENEQEAEGDAKYYFLCVRQNFAFYGVKTIKKL
ncbi:hypothetical protein [Chryseobacterium proteolyticum]|uniref:hypothetical protein n=1 Tax=Chryseobacterium proteolyticum TaxID=118127 RepID=UPI0039834318